MLLVEAKVVLAAWFPYGEEDQVAQTHCSLEDLVDRDQTEMELMRTQVQAPGVQAVKPA
jgi:hypothetical protein